MARERARQTSCFSKFNVKRVKSFNNVPHNKLEHITCYCYYFVALRHTYVAPHKLVPVVVMLMMLRRVR